MSIQQDIERRVRRCRSWFDHAAEMERRINHNAYDVFIFRWIALAALYDSDTDEPGIGKLQRFAERIIEADSSNAVAAAIEMEETLFASYSARVSKPSRKKNKIRSFRKRIHKNPTAAMTDVLFSMYDYRNLLVHGREDWGSSVEINKVGDAAKILSILIPIFADIMPNAK